eukprot:4428434-Prymnesium_polylepis.1
MAWPMARQRLVAHASSSSENDRDSERSGGTAKSGSGASGRRTSRTRGGAAAWSRDGPTASS